MGRNLHTALASAAAQFLELPIGLNELMARCGDRIRTVTSSLWQVCDGMPALFGYGHDSGMCGKWIPVTMIDHIVV